MHTKQHNTTQHNTTQHNTVRSEASSLSQKRDKKRKKTNKKSFSSRFSIMRKKSKHKKTNSNIKQQAIHEHSQSSFQKSIKETSPAPPIALSPTHIRNSDSLSNSETIVYKKTTIDPNHRERNRFHKLTVAS